jgi:ATP-dependent DNA helicase PIF1
LEACHVSKKPIPADGIVPTKLYCTNRNVDAENDRNLAALKGKEMVFTAEDVFKGTYTYDVQKSISDAMDKKSPTQLKLKIGAQVILTRNMPDRNLVNGSRGVVKSFQEARVDFDEEDDYKCSKYSKAKDSHKLYPVVHFSNGVQMLVREESVFQGGSSGAMIRYQLPLKLAWSLTVHKSQGMTIERAELQLDDAFDYGQVYVALSRITSLEGLWVRGGSITQSVVKAHPKVKAFYEKNAS